MPPSTPRAPGRSGGSRTLVTWSQTRSVSVTPHSASDVPGRDARRASCRSRTGAAALQGRPVTRDVTRHAPRRRARATAWRFGRGGCLDAPRTWGLTRRGPRHRRRPRPHSLTSDSGPLAVAPRRLPRHAPYPRSGRRWWSRRRVSNPSIARTKGEPRHRATACHARQRGRSGTRSRTRHSGSKARRVAAYTIPDWSTALPSCWWDPRDSNPDLRGKGPPVCLSTSSPEVGGGGIEPHGAMRFGVTARRLHHGARATLVWRLTVSHQPSRRQKHQAYDVVEQAGIEPAAFAVPRRRASSLRHCPMTCVAEGRALDSVIPNPGTGPQDPRRHIGEPPAGETAVVPAARVELAD